MKALSGTNLGRPKGAVLLDDEPAFIIDLLDRGSDGGPIGNSATDLGVQLGGGRPVLPLNIVELGMAQYKLLRSVSNEILGSMATVGHHAKVFPVGLSQQPLVLIHRLGDPVGMVLVASADPMAMCNLGMAPQRGENDVPLGRRAVAARDIHDVGASSGHEPTELVGANKVHVGPQNNTHEVEVALLE